MTRNALVVVQTEKGQELDRVVQELGPVVWSFSMN